jgi:O-antigen ligase/tetratricopeptide (TPR) repeat protein
MPRGNAQLNVSPLQNPLIKRLLCFLLAVVLLFLLPFNWGNIDPEVRYLSFIPLGLAWMLWILLQLREPRPVEIPKVVLPATLWIALMVALLPSSLVLHYGLDWTVNLLVVLLCFLVLSDLTRGTCRSPVWEDVLIGLSLLMISFDLITAALNTWRWWQIAGFAAPPPAIHRLRGIFFGHPSVVGSYLNIVLPLAIVRLGRGRTMQAKMWWTMILLAYLAMHYLASSRAAWLGLASLLVGMAGLKYGPLLLGALRVQKPIFTRRQLLLWAGIGSLVLLGGLTLLPALSRQIQKGAHGTLSDRLDIWQYAIQKISEAPIVGHGPGSPLFLYAQRSDALGKDEVFHSHNLLLETGLNGGLVGLLLIFWMGGWVIRAWLSSWRNTAPGTAKRDALIAYAGVGIGLVVQGMLDVVIAHHLIITMSVLCITALTYSQARKQEFFTLQRERALPFLIALALFCSASAYYVIKHNRPFNLGLQAAAQEEWVTAREKICTAADENPGVTFLLFQCGLANARLAYETNDPAALQAALDYQRKGLQLDPYWYLHWANLATYEWQQGDRNQAIQHMQQAAEAAPRKAFLWLNLGWMEEQAGLTDRAGEHYLRAICLEAYYRDVEFFDHKSFRRQILDTPCPDQDDISTNNLTIQYNQAGLQALRQGRFDEAEEYFRSAIMANLDDSVTYAYLGLAVQQAGRPAEAWQDVMTALFIYGQSMRINLVVGLVADAQGKRPEAIQYLTRAYELGSSPPILSTEYYLSTYRSMGLPSDLSPFFVKTGWWPEASQGFTRLITLLEEDDNFELAQKVQRWFERNAVQ